MRKGDVLLTVVHKGQHTELKSVEQFNKLLASLDKSAVITLQVKRGESTAFVTVSGELQWLEVLEPSEALEVHVPYP